jgi:exodeoxyribonuclease-3
MKIATWNVNGIRAREAQLLEWMATEQPDVLCLQEIKAATLQVPASLQELSLGDYWACWHGERGYSGVALLIRKEVCPERPAFVHPAFDFENRIVMARVGGLDVASIYVPNGGKDFAAKMQFLEAMDQYAAGCRAAGTKVVLCGDLNVARAEMDVHPKERKVNAIGQRPEERALVERILAKGLVDVGRALDPQNDQMFTWWPPWRNMRQRNIGWRLDYVLASEDLAGRILSCPVRAEVGTSDHAPAVATLSL